MEYNHLFAIDPRPTCLPSSPGAIFSDTGEVALAVFWLLKNASDNPQLFSMMRTESGENGEEWMRADTCLRLEKTYTRCSVGSRKEGTPAKHRTVESLSG